MPSLIWRFNKQLIAQDSIAAQQVTTQEALVKQYLGVIETDQGSIANAKLQLIMPALSPRLQTRRFAAS